MHNPTLLQTALSASAAPNNLSSFSAVLTNGSVILHAALPSPLPAVHPLLFQRANYPHNYTCKKTIGSGEYIDTYQYSCTKKEYDQNAEDDRTVGKALVITGGVLGGIVVMLICCLVYCNYRGKRDDTRNSEPEAHELQNA